MQRTKVPLIGIAGGIASGKSFVARQCERHGAAVVSADQLAHDVLRQPEVKEAIRARWGRAVFSDQGDVDRAALGKVVFAPTPEGAGELKVLEGLTHPKIGQMARDEIARAQQQATATAIVLDVPLLFESGWNKFCDKIIFVDAPRPVRQARAAARGWSEEDFSRREAAQESLETKRKLADVVMDNSGSEQFVRAQLEQFWPLLVGASVSP